MDIALIAKDGRTGLESTAWVLTDPLGRQHGLVEKGLTFRVLEDDGVAVMGNPGPFDTLDEAMDAIGAKFQGRCYLAER